MRNADKDIRELFNKYHFEGSDMYTYLRVDIGKLHPEDDNTLRSKKLTHFIPNGLKTDGFDHVDGTFAYQRITSKHHLDRVLRFPNRILGNDITYNISIWDHNVDSQPQMAFDFTPEVSEAIVFSDYHDAFDFNPGLVADLKFNLEKRGYETEVETTKSLPSRLSHSELHILLNDTKRIVEKNELSRD